MSQQASIFESRLAILHAAAHKQFDIKVVNPNNGKESPFDLKKTVPGCHLNIRFNENTCSSSSSSSSFPSLKLGDPAVRQHSKVLYLDPGSIAFELHAMITRSVQSQNRRQSQLDADLTCGGWLFALAAADTKKSSMVVSDFSHLDLFWSMIIHFHRTDECLPPHETSWNEDDSVMKKIVDTGNPQSKPTHPIGWALKAKHIDGATLEAANACRFDRVATERLIFSKDFDPIYNKHRNSVDMVTPTHPDERPVWWEAHNNLWTYTLQHFISSGKPPCPLFMRDGGTSGGCSGNCGFEHFLFKPLIEQVLYVVTRPFREQMNPCPRKSPSDLDVTGEIAKEEKANINNKLSLEERQTRLKERGNSFVKKQDHKSAIQFYNAAVELLPNAESTAAIYSNRSLCHLNLDNVAQALSDADKCIELRPTWFRGHFRRGCALEKLSKFEEAIAAFDEVVKLEPTEAEVVDEFKKRCSTRVSKSSSVDSTSKKGQEQKDDDDDDYEEVDAIVICADAGRTYNVKIPANFVKHADQIHKILGITKKDIESLENFLLTKDKRPSYYNQVQRFRPDAFHYYFLRDWVKDERNWLNKNAKSSSSASASASDVMARRKHVMPFGFQAAELVMGGGEKNHSNWLALVNPQSKGPLNPVMCSMLSQANMAPWEIDTNLSTCYCRGDAILVRLAKHFTPGAVSFRQTAIFSRMKDEVIQKFNLPSSAKKALFADGNSMMNALLTYYPEEMIATNSGEERE